MAQRVPSIHNKTQTVADADLPFNPANVLLQEDDLRAFFDAHGLRGVAFRNINLYRTAFVHRSYCTMKNTGFEEGNRRRPPDCLPLQDVSYERLEFLGDAVLGMVVARYLYERYPDQSEGFLSKMRTKIVNGKMLGSLAARIGFPRFAIISRQIEEANGRQNYKIMEDIFEAFLGALVQDFQAEDDAVGMPAHCPLVALSGAGYHVAETWVVSVLEGCLDFAELVQSRTSHKDTLARYMMAALKDSPRFFEVAVGFKDGAKSFAYCVRDKHDAVIGTARGASRKDAEDLAAKAALAYYGQGSGV